MKKEENKKLFRTWFYSSILLSCFIVICYITLHYFKPGNEVRTLTAGQLSAINNIIVKSIDSSNTKQDDNLGKSIIKNYLKLSLLVEFNNDTTARKNIDTLIKNNSLSNLLIILPTYPFEVKSFFWLKGSLTYLELLFWVWYGVMSSVLYTAVNVYNTGKFSGKLIWDHIAKLFYAPPIAIILYLCSDVLSSQQLIALDNISYGSIVFVFIVGFFSGRAIELLNRLKDVIIPLGANTQQNNEVSDLFNVDGFIDKPEEFKDIDISTAKVTLKNKQIPSFSFIGEVKNGKFEFDNVPAGLYQLEAEVQTDEIVLNATRNFFLKKGNNPDFSNVKLLLQRKF